ncbi:MAG: RluA family pseudouridine synthase [Deltaproteobacteria bacterium]|jgi:23S rRNA pseudouridine1911/1915/1917 synthase|nr:RluA family pseudouridine synthase [Deltaproteobacteria bacterium]
MHANHDLNIGVYRFSVLDKDGATRLDQFLAGQLHGCSRSLARQIIELGGVHLDGRRVRKCGMLVTPGQHIQVFVDGFPLQSFALDPEQILYRDKHLLVINKPAGIPSQPIPSRYRGTIYAALQQLLKSEKLGQYQPSIGMVQRLDRDTSGVMVFSIHPAAHKPLTQAFSQRAVGKRYLALVSGEVPDATGQFKSYLARRRSTNRMVSVARGGRYAETLYRRVQTFGIASLVEIELITGRSHQIRAHFGEAGHPLLGDAAYGGPSEINELVLPRQMLHAWQLKLQHPINKNVMRFTAELPEDFKKLLLYFGGELERYS